MNSTNFAQTIIGEATSEAVTKLAQGLEADSGKLPTVAAAPISGLIADASTPDIIINVGSKERLEGGRKAQSDARGAGRKGSGDGQATALDHGFIGELTITSVDAGSAVGHFSGSSTPKIGDEVKSQ